MAKDPRRSLVAAALVALVGAVVFAQGEQRPVFRAGVEIYELEVSVLDKNRQPVRGLTSRDFTVLEDGKPQPIVEFSEVEVPGRDGPIVSSEELAAPDVTSIAFADRRLFALVLDDFGMPFGAGGGLADNVFAAPEVKRVAREFVQSLGPKDLAAVMLTRDPRNFPDFTNVWSKLTGAIDQFKPPGEAEAMYLMQATRGRVGIMATLKDAIYYMAKLPQHSKSIVYIGHPQSVDFARRRISGDADRAEDVFAAAQAAGIAISGFDVRGTLDRSQYGLLIALAENTGGYAVGFNNIGAGLAQIFLENQSYYLLGYQPGGPADGKFRRLEVKIDRPGVTVRAKRGYNAPAPPDMTKAQAPAYDPAVEAALKATTGGSEDRRLFTYAVRRPGGVTVATEIGMSESVRPMWAAGAEVEVSLLDSAGKTLATTTGRIEAAARGARLELPLGDPTPPSTAPGAVPIRVTVRVRAAGGVLEDTVPALDGGQFLGPAQVFRGGLSPRAPLNAVAEFQFLRSERLKVDWPERQPVDQRQARLLRRTGEPTTFSPALTETEGPTGRVLSTTFPLGQIAAGEYVIEVVVARGGESERRLLAFRIAQ